MSRFIIKHLRWKKEWGDVGTPYDFKCSDNSRYTRITDPNLPRVGEFFTDENGVTYLHTFKNGTHAYVKAKVDGAKNIFSERSYEADFIQERKSLDEVKVFDEHVKCISSLENEYIAILASDNEGDFVEFQNFKDFFCKEDASVSLGGTDNYLFRLDSAAKAIYLCRTVRGLTLLVHYANNTLGFFCYDIILDQESQFDPENVGFYPIDISESNIPASTSYIIQLSEDGQFMFFDDVITEINLNPSEVGDITAAAGSPISVVAKPLVKSLSKAWQKEYTHRLDSADGSARNFVIPVHSGNTTKALVYDSNESDKWQIKNVGKNYGENAVCSVIGLSKFVIRDVNKTDAYKLGLNNVPTVYSQNLPDAEILIDDSDYQYSRLSGKLFEERCSVSVLKEGTNGYHVDNITVADTKANGSSLDRDVFKNAVFGASISNITYLGLGYVTVVGSNAANTTTIVANTGFISSIENINVEEINAEKITVRNNEDDFNDGVTIDHDSMELKNGNNKIVLDVGKDDKSEADKVTLKASNKNASSGSEITETSTENKVVNKTLVNQGDKPKVEETVTVNNNGASIVKDKVVSDTKESETIKNNEYNRTVTSENDNNTSKLTESVTSGDGTVADEGYAEREIAKRRNADIGSESEREKGSFVRETVGSNKVTLERAVNLGNNDNVHEKIEMKDGQSGFDYERSLDVENKIAETVTAAEINKTSTVGGNTVITETADGSSYSNTAVNGNKKISDSFDGNEAGRSAEYSSTKYVKETVNDTSSLVDVKNGDAQVEVKASGTSGADNDINMHLPDSNTREVVNRAGAIKTAAGSAVSGDTFSDYKIYMRKNNKTYETSIQSLDHYFNRVERMRHPVEDIAHLEPDIGAIHYVVGLSSKYIKLIETSFNLRNSDYGCAVNFDLFCGTAGARHTVRVNLSVRIKSGENVGSISHMDVICSGISGLRSSNTDNTTFFRTLLHPSTDNNITRFEPYANISGNKVYFGLAIRVATGTIDVGWPEIYVKFNSLAEDSSALVKTCTLVCKESSSDAWKYVTPDPTVADFKLTSSECIVSSLSSTSNINRTSDGSDVFGPNGIGAATSNGVETPVFFNKYGIPTALSPVYTKDKSDELFILKSLITKQGDIIYGSGNSSSAVPAKLAPPSTNGDYYLFNNKNGNIRWQIVRFAYEDDVVKYSEFVDKGVSSDPATKVAIVLADYETSQGHPNPEWYGLIGPNNNDTYYLSITDNTIEWKSQTDIIGNFVSKNEYTSKGTLVSSSLGRTSFASVSTTDDRGSVLAAAKSGTPEFKGITNFLLHSGVTLNIKNDTTNVTKSCNITSSGGTVTLTSDFFRVRRGEMTDATLGKVFSFPNYGDTTSLYVVKGMAFLIGRRATMSTIRDELANFWGSLTDAQKEALKAVKTDGSSGSYAANIANTHYVDIVDPNFTTSVTMESNGTGFAIIIPLIWDPNYHMTSYGPGYEERSTTTNMYFPLAITTRFTIHYNQNSACRWGGIWSESWKSFGDLAQVIEHVRDELFTSRQTHSDSGNRTSTIRLFYGYGYDEMAGYNERGYSELYLKVHSLDMH